HWGRARSPEQSLAAHWPDGARRTAPSSCAQEIGDARLHRMSRGWKEVQVFEAPPAHALQSFARGVPRKVESAARLPDGGPKLRRGTIAACEADGAWHPAREIRARSSQPPAGRGIALRGRGSTRPTGRFPAPRGLYSPQSTTSAGSQCADWLGLSIARPRLSASWA